jgi:hypothetical protein
MALAAVVENQFTDGVDRAAYTSGSITPVAGALYVAFFVGRTNNLPYVHCEVTGTNGWSGYWNEVKEAQAVYNFAGLTRCGMSAYWTLATSGVAGTIRFAYPNVPILRAGTMHLLRIDGGPSLTAPVGVTGSAHDDTGSAAVITATLTGTPRTDSIIVACAMSDLNSGTMTPTAPYANLGSMQVPINTGISQPMFDEAPVSATVQTTFSGADINALSAVEIRALQPSPPDLVYLAGRGEEWYHIARDAQLALR